MSRVELTYAGDHYQDEIWTLKRVQSGLVLLDQDEVVVTRISADEVNTRIILPSFLRSLPFLLIVGKKTTHPFNVTRRELRGVRELIADCVEQAPGAAATDCIARAKSALKFGAPLFGVGVVLVIGGAVDRNIKGFGVGVVGTSVGMIAFARAAFLFLKSRSLRAKARSMETEVFDNDDNDDE
ncbi:hypothetical protein [Tuwongella immobilis]|uniref:Uncharacterized protein n=1 Tax=Tuwongella immobilis TaxID=692036 RepID=A0A6C2YGJ5_9BACT|nr:hypothetical protein [Tuwongella immobilis]VIP00618.1 unnamed protein product [Tuwongella immobilis]VTR96654.1 unnamed protein product [Tuwongella immobilis]